MSDTFRDIAKRYEDNVLAEQHPRSIGLFTIPEYPEDEAERGMWSAAVEAILTTLRYLAPATLLTLFWGQQSFIFKLLKHIDSAFRAIVFSSEEQKQSVLEWLSETGPVRVENLDTVWRHGWIMCGVLDAALPGACAGHPPTRLSLKHAQAIADHYLGVEPVFSRQELDSNDSLSKHQEWKLATYLDRVRLAISKITPPVSKPGSQRTSPDASQFTIDYVAKGSGLSAAQINNKMYFKIYPTAQQSLDPGEITILIRGPKDTYGMAVLPPLLGKAQLIRQKLLGLQTKPNYTENVLPITQGTRYLRNYGKNDMNKTYYIPKTKYDIEIEDELRTDHVKISYVVSFEGRYEIYITSRGQNIVGSPFTVTASQNIINILERDSYCLEDGEEIGIVDVKTDRKVVLRIVDFVTEKMLLRENGTLEKITDDEAKILMTTDKNVTPISDDNEIHFKQQSFLSGTENQSRKISSDKFNKAVRKVITTSRICKILYSLLAERNSLLTTKDKNIRTRGQQDIPDIVNSTLSDTKLNPYIIPESRDKFIIPENISVSILTEKHEPDFVKHSINETKHSETDLYDDTCSQDSLEDYEPINEEIDNNLLLNITSSSSNPFLCDDYKQDYKTEKDLGSFVANEYETNNSQNEETENTSIKIIIDENDSMSPINNNPFIDPNVIELERPKSPVFKIISGEINTSEDSFYTDPKSYATELANEFVNPFFIHHHQSNEEKDTLPTTDFIIGAPVSLPPLIRSASPIPEMESLIITTPASLNEERRLQKEGDDEPSSVFSTPLHTNVTKSKESHRAENNSSVTSTYHSMDSNIIENVNISNESGNNTNLEVYQAEALPSRNVSPKKEIWDSAYVSIDDNNSSPDSNNNDNTPLCDAVNKQKFSPSDESFGLRHEDLSNMGPAERELWQTCSELKDNVSQDDLKSNKLELKRRIFTPIIEESDRSLSSGVKDIVNSETSTKPGETDLVTVAFAELNDMYQEYFPNSENDTTIDGNEVKLQDLEVDLTKETDNKCVDSASENIADVKRHTNESEGKISEVQANVAESDSVSHTLQEKLGQYIEPEHDNKDETQFGDRKHSNIVLERKKYWDERIRQIEAKSEESTTLQKKRRLSSKHLRNNDSLTKRRGKHIVKNFLNAEKSKEKPVQVKSCIVNNSGISLKEDIKPNVQVQAEIKLVDKWRKYWDNKLETDSEIDTLSCFRAKSPKNKIQISTQAVNTNIEDSIETDPEKDKLSSPVKQELPEEVFKAFETSPKRFFGTSRKQILSKIDTFLGKPSTVDKSSPDVIGASPDSGLVSSRISMFHKISNTEDVSWSRRKSQSMQNINQRKDNDKSVASLDKGLDIIQPKDTQITELNPAGTLKLEIYEINTEAPQRTETFNKLSLKDKRAKMAQNSSNKSFDETTIGQQLDVIGTEKPNLKKLIKDLNKQSQHKQIPANELRRTSISRSEMDIFNKTALTSEDDDLNKYKSCDELPKINVKNFISLYESVSKTTSQSTSVGKLSKVSLGYQKSLPYNSSQSGAASNSGPPSISQSHSIRSRSYTSTESVSVESADSKMTSSFEIVTTPVQDKETTYVSLSDIELEIIETSTDKSVESTEPSPAKDPEAVKKDYKSRFKMAKEFFQSLEELREVKNTPKLNECQLLLQNKSTESLDNNKPKRRVKKKVKSHSMPSSEIAKIWTEMQNEDSNNKLVKISEKFNVDDLFSDVMAGKLSRQGSLRGIPHKKAVLEAFRSMENIHDNTISPYEIAVSQLSDFAKENQIKNAQTYLSEYPYLPKTDPSKYHSRLDHKASGLISLKELLNKKPRRNSVPDIRLNPTFTADL